MGIVHMQKWEMALKHQGMFLAHLVLVTYITIFKLKADWR
jgi:hypothetical protein